MVQLSDTGSRTGEFEPSGFALAYMCAERYVDNAIMCLIYSPAVVGNLWPVTDRDLDSVTMHILRSWLQHEQPSVVFALSLFFCC